MKNKKTVTQNEAIALARTFGTPDDYGCNNWDEVLSAGMEHVDGLAVALGIDDEYTVQYDQ